MKRLFTLFFVVSVLSATMWAADVSLVERFSAINQTSSVASDTWAGDVCNWATAYTRHKLATAAEGNQDIIIVDEVDMNSCWMSTDGSTQVGNIQTTDWEGGIKAVSFRWAQFGAESKNTLQLRIAAGTIENDTETRAGSSGENKTTGGTLYSHSFENKANCQLSITNISTKGGGNSCRILIGDITITPYIYYTTKNAIIEVGSSTYENTDLIKNIDGEGGTLLFSSANTDIATVNETTGVVTGVAAGCTEIIAKYTWPASGGEVTTRYTIVVNKSLTEAFTNVEQAKSSGAAGSTWSGDYCTWQTNFARRKNTDKIGDNQATWLAMSNTVRGTLKTTDWEGGIKSVSFPYAQFDTEAENHLKLDVRTVDSTGETIDSEEVERGAESDEGINKTTGETYKWECNCKQNAQLHIVNTSIKRGGGDYTSGNPPRWLVGDVTITPYLYYTKKSAAMAVGGTYTNTWLIDNTACEGGTLTYETSDASIATVSEGVVTGVRVGEATITAKYTWDETHYVTASYTIRVVESNALVEDFSKIPGGSISADGSAHSYEGNYCTWWCRNVSYGGNNYKLNDGTRGFWLSHTVTGKDNTSAYIETARDPNYQEGGIKHVSFKWHQFGNASDQTIKLQLKVNNTAKDVIEVDGGNASADICVNDQTYESNNAVSSKSNAKLTIANVSYKTGEPATYAQGRVIIGPISITPYLFYMKREKAIGIGERYTHPLLDNTDGEGTITYSISSSSVASINNSTGEVVGKTTGDATITATWSEGATTTYTLHVSYDLEDNADNSSIITSLDGRTVSVRLKDRTIYCDGDFNTICLPFALSKEQLAESPLAGFEIMDFTNAYLSGSGDAQQLDVRFTETDHIEAGRPYLISKSAASDITNPVFENVLISDVEGATVEGTSLNFVGILKPTVLNENNLFVAAGNQLYWWVDGQSDEDSSLKSYRAFFAVPGTLSEPALAQLRRASARIVTSTEIATGIENAEHQKSDVESLKTIENGQLIIIRDGMKYNIFGQIVK